jgi:hypothetical protein
MQEKIERPEVNTVNLEQAREGQDVACEVEVTKENDEMSKEHLLEKIYQKREGANTNPKFSEIKDVAEENTINKIVKEFYSVGSKVIGRARKVLGAYGLDRLHDELTNKNKSNKQ